MFNLNSYTLQALHGPTFHVGFIRDIQLQVNDLY